MMKLARIGLILYCMQTFETEQTLDDLIRQTVNVHYNAWLCALALTAMARVCEESRGRIGPELGEE